MAKFWNWFSVMKFRERKVFFAARGASTAVVGAVCGLSLAPPGPIGPCNVLILIRWENHNKDCHSCVGRKKVWLKGIILCKVHFVSYGIGPCSLSWQPIRFVKTRPPFSVRCKWISTIAFRLKFSFLDDANKWNNWMLECLNSFN